jgi:hypothetical protein
MRLKPSQLVGLACAAKKSVGKVTRRDAVLTALDGLAELLDPMPARFMLHALRRYLEYNLVRRRWD